ncbi:MAG: hypothetical protein HEP71_10955 [Roseivirga sp.]|nr:hypothetical protein [Roseivirga sp.]
MIRKTITLLTCLLLPAFAQAQVKAYPVDSWHSSISFSARFGGLVPVRGSFDQFSGTVLLDESDLTKTSATIFIAAASIDTGLGMRDNHLKSDDFFDVEKHPQLSFSSTRVIIENNALVMEGILRMHGVAKEVRIPFVLAHGEQPDPWKNFRITLQGTLELNRLDFGIGEGQDTIGETITIDLVISARIFNTETIALFNRPFGIEMMKAFKEGGTEAGRKAYEKLKASGDKDAVKPGSFEFLHLKLKQTGHIRESLLAAEFFVEIFPEDAEAQSLLGYAYYEHKDLEKAGNTFQKALALDEKESLALEMLKVLK